MEENLKSPEEARNGCPKDTNVQKSENLSRTLVFYVNGVEIRESQIEPEWTLLYYLRNKLGLTGTKLGCAEGGCGACTVMISRYDREGERIINFSANACLMPVCALHGSAVITVEGIGSTRTKLHPVQERIAKAHGSQCGFCTPGMVMSMYALLRTNPKPNLENLKSAFDGNLCRCTGYRPIWEGFKTFTEEWKQPSIPNGTVFKRTENVCTMGENCCKRAFTSEPNELFDTRNFRPYDSSQEPIFPPKLMTSSEFDKQYLIIEGKNVTWYRPNKLEELLTLKNCFPDAKIVVGNTEVGVEVKFKNCHYSRLIQPTRIKEMGEIKESDQELQIGANVTLSELEDLLKHQIQEKDEFKTRIFLSIVKMLRRFAGMQIRNVASIGGNIITSSPISDLNPVFMAAGVKLNLASFKSGFRTVEMDHVFMTGYRKNVVAPDEVLVSISVPFSKPNQYFVAYKQARRRDDDIAIVNMALNVMFEPEKRSRFVTEEKQEAVIENSRYKAKLFAQATPPEEIAIVQKANLVFGGMGPTTIVAKKTSESLIGEKWTRNVLEKVYNNLLEELPLAGDAPGGMVLYRRSLILSLFFKAFCFVEEQLGQHFFAEPYPSKNSEQCFEPYLQNKSEQPNEPYPQQNCKQCFESCLQNNSEQSVGQCLRNNFKQFAEPYPQTNSEQCFEPNPQNNSEKRVEPCPPKNFEQSLGQCLHNNSKQFLEPCPQNDSRQHAEPYPPKNSKQRFEPCPQNNFRQSLGQCPKKYSEQGLEQYPKQNLGPCYNQTLSQKESSKQRESASQDFDFKDPTSSQYFQVATKNQSWDMIGKPMVHSSALKQATGEALYCDDVQQFKDELYVAFVLSSKAHANILKIDPSEALALEGVIAFFDASDISDICHPSEDKNFYELIARDEQIFASKTVLCQGRPIGAIAAVDQLTAQKAVALVKVEYENLEPIITIEDAITQDSFFPGYPVSIISGNPDSEFKKANHVLTGEVRVGGQDHFYLETQATVAVPRDGDSLEVFCSTQNPSEVQKLIARLLGLPSNKITIRVQRIGGGFGGKDTRAAMVALPVAFVAYKLQKPVRCMLDRAEDMMMTGNRHPFLHKYKIGFDKNGLIRVAEVQMFLNAGCTLDVSAAVLDRGMFHFENSYKIPACRVTGYLCKTNLPSNVAFRGFGGPQSMFVAENIIRDVAEFLGRDMEDLMKLNFYKEGDLTHYNQRLDYCTLDRCWEECLRSSDFRKRKAEIAEFNRSNRYKKRGIAVVSAKHGIAFAEQFLNQGGALVNVYLDGSVLITHGGVEMGQGLHTKMIQIASRVLELDSDKIHIAETSTDKVPNTITTGSSISSDMYGMAVLEACEKIKKRIQSIVDENPEGPWEHWIQKAFLQRIQLSATGFHRVPDVGYCRETNSGILYHYFTYGVGCTEVEIDCLTGDHQVLRTDIVMDLGESLNPAIDIGQIEGAFLQGYGLFTLEEIVYSREGSLLSRGPGTYKIPGFSDIPQQLNVSLLKGAPNPRAIYSSKAVGEPPLFLASSAFFAIKEAIKSAREDANIFGRFRLDAPATAEKIRMACVDELTSRIKDDDKKAWNVEP